ncbi:MAG: amino acid--tRNA ligase-related protein [Chitinophagales bacterium]
MQYFDSEPLKVRALQYDMVMNGNEICSGSIRINNCDYKKEYFWGTRYERSRAAKPLWLYVRCL